MFLFETEDQVISTLFIWLFGFIVVEKVRKKFGVRFKIAYSLYVWHSLFCIVYLILLQNNIGDAIFYYNDAKTGAVDFNVGTTFVVYFASLFIIPFNLSMAGIFLIFNIFGYVGLLAWYGSLNILTKNKSLFTKRLALITVFLPSVSFWSSALGKDALAFFSIGLALWAVINLKKRIILMIIAIIVMLMVRPHIAGFMVISITVGLIFDKRISLYVRGLFLIVSVVALIIMIPFALEYAGIDNISKEAELLTYIENRQSYNQGRGGIDISSMSIPMKLYTYLFRPLPFEAHSITQFLASIDNLFLLILFLLFVKQIIQKRNIQNDHHYYYNIAFMINFILLTWMTLSLMTPNLGIAMRQKWMFVPFLVFIFFIYIGSVKNKFHK